MHNMKAFARPLIPLDSGQTHDASIIREGHRAGRQIDYRSIEKLHGLDALPSTDPETAVSCALPAS